MMGRLQFIVATTVALIIQSTQDFTISTPVGMAAGATGEGYATPVYSTALLTPKTFDFRGIQGTTTEP
ncbi:hypothetical protein BBP00_00005473 [Phytophthora kernoviae]|uniref:Uncharacterized protein n=1 Tax=Phytophthora kernoviae TaxID=325452 RepID=A0A3F2RNW8_9STRA|nr:hypothetical protein BBP00_00005473 [Phytophthora kernoviae]